ncbi:MAG: replicative DNA helicase, partial [Chitinophagaceae bacterium]
MDLTNLNKDRKTRRKSGSLDLGTMMYGKVPPQAKDLEEAVLGAIMLEKSAFDTVAEILKPECFYVEANQRIFRSMQGLQQKNLPIDLLTVVEELKLREELDVVGGPYYVSKLTNAVVSSTNLEAHSRIILQKFIQRELIRISGEIIGDAYEDSTDVFELLDESESKLFEITNNHLRKDYASISDVLVKTIQRIEDLRTRQDEISGVPTGFALLDRITYGWQPTDLIILAARPSVGKTAFALNLARNAALHPTKPTAVGFFSLEMSAGQLVQRILSAESEIWLEKIARGRLEEH